MKKSFTNIIANYSNDFNFDEFDNYLVKRFIPTYINFKSFDGSKIKYIRLCDITKLNMPDELFIYVMNFFKERDIHVIGSYRYLIGEFENYVYYSLKENFQLPLTISKKELQDKIIEYKKTKNIDVRNEIILGTLKPVNTFVEKFSKLLMINKDDLIDEAYLSLIKSLEDFNLSMNCSFISYAIICIKNDLLTSHERYFCSKTAKKYYFYLKYILEVEQTNCDLISRNPELIYDVIALMIHNGILDNEQNVIMQAYNKISSIVFNYISLDNDELIEEGYLIDPVDYENRQIKITTIEEICNILTLKERQVIYCKFGLNDGIEKNNVEVGRIFGITRQRVQSIVKSAISRLKKSNQFNDLKELYDLEIDTFGNKRL